jgi:hypothetical protein
MPKFQNIIKNILLYKILHFVTSELDIISRDYKRIKTNYTHLCFTAHQCISVNQIGGCINLLKPTVHVMQHQFNIQQLYALLTLYLCVLYLSENKQRIVPLTA